MRAFILSVAIVLMVASNVVAQLWAVQVIDTTTGGMGSGTVIAVHDQVQDGWRYGIVATASHVTESTSGIQIVFENGRSSSKCSVIERDRQNDIALVRCLVPENVRAVAISDVPAVEGDTISYVGRGRRKFTGDVSCLAFDDEIWADVVFVPGDSGGSVLLNGKLIGVISGGLRWAPNEPRRTYPGRSNNTQPLRILYDRAMKSKAWIGNQTQSSKSIKFKDYEAGDLDYDGLQLVVFSASWCNPCKNLKAELRRQSDKLAEYRLDRIVVVDVDVHSKLAKEWQVRMYPTTFITKKGQREARVAGASANDIMNILAKIGSQDD